MHKIYDIKKYLRLAKTPKIYLRLAKTPKKKLLFKIWERIIVQYNKIVKRNTLAYKQNFTKNSRTKVLLAIFNTFQIANCFSVALTIE